MKIGDKVVCVDDSPCRCGCGQELNVKQGVIYVVSGFKIWNGILGLLLVGVIQSHKEYGNEAAIAASRFRLLDHLKEKSQSLKETYA